MKNDNKKQQNATKHKKTNLGGRAVEVEDFSVNAALLTIDWHNNTMQQNNRTELCRNCFEQWLEETGRLNWCNDMADEHGDHIQDTGTLPVDNYWQHAEYEVKTQDLKAFLLAEVKAQAVLS